MSGFAMHRFRTIDQPLTRAEMDEIDSWSSRSSPTSTGVTYVYHYGSFGQNAEKVFPKYFDAMLYVDSWGTKQLMFRFPKDLVDWKGLTQFTNIKEYYRHLDFKRVGNYVIMDLYWNEEEGGEWVEEEDYILDTFLPLREEILNGDYRTLYLGWLMVEQYKREKGHEEEYDDYDEDYSSMPSIPANLQRLTTAHQYLIEKFEITEDIVKAAAAVSPNASQQQPDYKKLIALLSNEEKEAFLLRFAIGERRTEIQLRQRLEELGDGKKELAFGKSPSWEALTKKAKIIENEAAKEAAEVQRVAHINRMEKLISQKMRLWHEAENNILKAQGNSYDKATKILYELKEIAAYEKEERKFEQKLGEFISPYIRRAALIRRLRAGGVMGIKG
ncbi:MAG: hypothetical protein AB8G86_30250 [Saprospiraceae bacterium]